MGAQWLGVFLQGMAAMACIAIALFFLQFWRKTADRLFLIFAVAFSLMCLTRLVATALGSAAVASGAVGSAALAEAQVHHSTVYAVRFVAYMLIVAAIIDKSR